MQTKLPLRLKEYLVDLSIKLSLILTINASTTKTHVSVSNPYLPKNHSYKARPSKRKSDAPFGRRHAVRLRRNIIQHLTGTSDNKKANGARVPPTLHYNTAQG